MTALLATFRNISTRSLRVWQRDIDVYRTNWRTEFLPPLLEPILYVFAFGFGLGSLVPHVQYLGRPVAYLNFMAPGIVAVAIMFWAFFETTYSSFVRMYYQRTFDAILATPLLVEDVIAGEMLWGATKAVIAASIMLGVLTALHLVAWPASLWVLPVALAGGLLFAGLGLVITALTTNISQFNLPIFLLITPMFVFSGTFFPVDVLPLWARVVAWALPLTHIAALVRAAVMGLPDPAAGWHVAYLAAAALALPVSGLVLMKRRLIP